MKELIQAIQIAGIIILSGIVTGLAAVLVMVAYLSFSRFFTAN